MCLIFREVDGRCRWLVVEGGFGFKFCFVKLMEERLVFIRRYSSGVILVESRLFLALLLFE